MRCRKAEERITALKDELKPLAEAEQSGKELPGLETELAALEKEKERISPGGRPNHHRSRGRDQGTGRRGGADCYRSGVGGGERANCAKRLLA